MDLRESGWRSVEWIQLAQDRDWWQAVVNTVADRGRCSNPDRVVM
jgi:hypothetical protein